MNVYWVTAILLIRCYGAAEETLTRREELKRRGWDLKRLVTEVCRMLSVDPEDLQKKGRASSLSCAKGLICYFGHSRLGLTGKELARYFIKLTPSPWSPNT